MVHKLQDSIVVDGKLDEIYWKLRQVYYLEHEFKKKTGQFTDQIKDLGLQKTFYNNVKIVLKDSVFLVSMPHKNNYIYLQSDSKIFIK
ncbi:MAG: hypothetical protein OEW75_03435 [Cyclobacteriaceae bacterium]|nr:hypothetical protein [Cyclobacteriaceae bacterium]